MIKLRAIEESYRTGAGETFVLRRVDADIAEGEFVTIMGLSGAGRSTLLSILGHVGRRLVGRVSPVRRVPCTRCGRSIAGTEPRYMGFVFQQYHLLDDLTVYENLEIPLSYRGVKRKDR